MTTFYRRLIRLVYDEIVKSRSKLLVSAFAQDFELSEFIQSDTDRYSR